ncbi:hypothetical protein FOA52_015060 [Chlamydomonas sp. UWO 241]|nr:hypothetical protein FOA52_015060 [Chlamydomonas sp. UWO 241]
MISMLLLAPMVMIGVNAWWDGGHMRTAAVATAYLESWNNGTALGPILEVLEGPDGMTSYTGLWHDIIDSSIWMDFLKCSFPAPYCASGELKVVPNIQMFGNWHYNSACKPVNYYPSQAASCAGSDREDFGVMLNRMGALISEFKDVVDPQNAAIRIRLLSHLLGDLHQPMHSLSGTDSNHPAGDVGGNNRRFNNSRGTPCAVFGNLHALWDAGGDVAANDLNWKPSAYESEQKDSLLAYGREVVANGSSLPDPFHFERLDTATFAEGVAMLTGDYGLLAQVNAYMADFAVSNAYRNGIELNPKVPGGILPCPSQTYLDMAYTKSQEFIGLGGYRMAKVFAFLSRQMVAKGVAGGTAPTPMAISGDEVVHSDF